MPASTLFVGIDVDSKSNKVRFIDSDGRDLSKPLSVKNTPKGASEIERKILELVNKHGFHAVRIGLEATGYYDWHLAEYLAQSPHRTHIHIEVYRLDPRRIRNFKKSYAKEDKTDPFDALVVADFLRFNRLPKPHRASNPFEALRHLTRYRFHLVRIIVREQNFLLSRLFLQFSGFQQNKPLSDTFGAISQALLENFTPDELVSMPQEKLLEFVIRHGKNRVREPELLVKTLKRAAKESYRLRPALRRTLGLVLCLSLRNIRTLRTALRDVDKAIAKELEAFPNTLTSVPGIGPVYSAGLIAELGEIERFSSHNKIAKMAGLVWPKKQSGHFEAQDLRRAKHGNRYLRYYFVEAANALRVHNAEYRTYYEQKLKEVRKHAHKRAVVLTARKLVRLVFSMLKKNQLYSASYQQPTRSNRSQ